MRNNESGSPVVNAWKALSTRERLLLMLVVLVPVGIFCFTELVEPMLEKQKGVAAELRSTEQVLLAQQALWTAISGRAIPDPNRRAQQELERLMKDLSKVGSTLEKAFVHLVRPHEMQRLLYQVLQADRGVSLKSVEKLPLEAVSMALTDDPAAATEAVRLYRHPLSVTLTGRYQALYEYLLRVEKLHVGFFWDRLELSVEEAPEVSMKVRFYTVSTEENWLGE